MFQVLRLLVHFEQRIPQIEEPRLFLDIFLRQQTVVLDERSPCPLHGSSSRTIGKLCIDNGIVAFNEGFQLLVTAIQTLKVLVNIFAKHFPRLGWIARSLLI